MAEKREIELHCGDAPRRRLVVGVHIGVLVVPVQAADGLGQISYMPSGLHTDDGVEIWTPQKWERQ